MAQASPFVWGSGGQKLSPAQTKRYQDIAVALAANSPTPRSFGEGLAAIGKAIEFNAYTDAARRGEEAGSEKRRAIIESLMSSPNPSQTDIMAAMSEPWVHADPATSSLVSTLFADSRRQADPMYQAQLDQITDPGPEWQTFEAGGDIYRWNAADPSSMPEMFFDGPAAMPQPTDTMRNLEWRATEAGLRPGTPEYQSFMLNGGSAAGGDSAREEQIARIMETGIDRNTAIGVVDGILRVDRDPITGASQVINIATGERVFPQVEDDLSPALQPETPPSASQIDPFASNPYPATSDSFGVGGAIRGAINVIGDATGFGAPYEDVQDTQASFNVLREQVLNDLASGYNRQPPSWLLQEIRNLTPAAGSPFEGAEGARSKLVAIGRQLQNELELNQRRLSGPLSPTGQQEVEARILGLQSAIDRVRGAVQSFGGAEASFAAPTGDQPYVDGTVIENEAGQRMVMRSGSWEFI